MGQVPDLSRLTHDDIAALAGGRCDRPFDILGPHEGWLTACAFYGFMWDASDKPLHKGVQALVRDLNHLCRKDAEPDGFRWIATDPAQSAFAWIRRGDAGDPPVVVACTLTPVPRPGFRIGVPQAGPWREAINTDAQVYGSSGMGNLGGVMARDKPQDGQPASMGITLPPLSAVILVAGKDGEGEDG
ncbi:hypothetical protein GIY56_07855 [Paracoccus sp. YIM 132242]|uniref:Alpha-amylase/branching enzyme C-terminal all beta domain-containing protein n=1 Tax=Paracoccus lichenicola TaxID=2665644 RepID=A0A6L6HSD0_9RHOB|nr:alpha amylase C-terminal domain-containing protein [Paracoccus lichenicola]MTE00198.1 hypothetical protein [Paracoccus lichenicola]